MKEMTYMCLRLGNFLILFDGEIGWEKIKKSAEQAKKKHIVIMPEAEGEIVLVKTLKYYDRNGDQCNFFL